MVVSLPTSNLELWQSFLMFVSRTQRHTGLRASIACHNEVV